MNKLKNSFPLGIALGLAFSIILLILLDSILYGIFLSLGNRLIKLDAVFALSILADLFFARYYLKKGEKQELGKGFLFSSFIWGAAYVYLFHVAPIKHLFFNF